MDQELNQDSGSRIGTIMTPDVGTHVQRQLLGPPGTVALGHSVMSRVPVPEASFHLQHSSSYLHLALSS